MLKRTVVFERRCFLSLTNGQLQYDPMEDSAGHCIVPLEDLGVVILEHQAVTVTTALLRALEANGTVVVLCDSTHLPCALIQSIAANTTHTEVLRAQVDASLPQQKRIWCEIVKAKIRNQAALLKERGSTRATSLHRLIREVRSGDSSNREGVAARTYWGALQSGFKRDRDDGGANALLNYGYAILRAAAARALVSSGLHCALGVHHRNRYNPFCLVDDFMEPFRPFVDRIVFEMVDTSDDCRLEKATKARLLSVLSCDVFFENECGPLSLALTRGSASLVRSLKQKQCKLIYPRLE